jgi:hypothetical protein
MSPNPFWEGDPESPSRSNSSTYYSLCEYRYKDEIDAKREADHRIECTGNRLFNLGHSEAAEIGPEIAVSDERLTRGRLTPYEDAAEESAENLEEHSGRLG